MYTVHPDDIRTDGRAKSPECLTVGRGLWLKNCVLTLVCVQLALDQMAESFHGVFRAHVVRSARRKSEKRGFRSNGLTISASFPSRSIDRADSNTLSAGCR